MSRITTKPFTENQLQYYSYINYNFYNDYLISEDLTLESIDADLPTAHELLEQRKTYNETAKRIDQEIKKMKRKFGKVTTMKNLFLL